MATKPLSRFTSNRQDSDKVNNNDRDAKGDFACDPYGEGNPNAMGPTMRPLYNVYASAASGLADEHDRERPPPHVQKGEVAAGVGRASPHRPGPAGKWPGAE